MSTALFAAFDLYPSPKGAATHIYHSAQALFDFFGKGILYSLSNTGYETDLLLDFGKASVRHITFDTPIANYLERALAYGAQLTTLLQREEADIELIHFRDIWSGKGIFESGKSFKTVFEVNALMSIELPYRYDLPRATIEKITFLEQMCLLQADCITCPSAVIKANLMQRGIAEDKITVIPNGADIPDFEQLHRQSQGLKLPQKYMLYFGALQPWQGVDDLLKAFVYLQDYEELYLVLCIAGSSKYAKYYQKLAENLQIQDRIIWHFSLDKNTLNSWINSALFSVAPLKDTPRNTQQGCSPLKIFESMALKTAVLSTDLPVVREILTDGQTGKLVRADRPNELARAMRFMLDYPDFTQSLAARAFQLIENNYNWTKIKAQLGAVYTRLEPISI